MFSFAVKRDVAEGLLHDKLFKNKTRALVYNRPAANQDELTTISLLFHLIKFIEMVSLDSHYLFTRIRCKNRLGLSLN